MTRLSVRCSYARSKPFGVFGSQPDHEMDVACEAGLGVVAGGDRICDHVRNASGIKASRYELEDGEPIEHCRLERKI